MQQVAPAIPPDESEARHHAAAMFGTNRQYVSDAKKIKNEAPEVFEQIKTGKTTITQAKRTLRENKREERRQENRDKVAHITEPTKLLENGRSEGSPKAARLRARQNN